MFFCPSLSYVSQEFFFAGPHLADQRLVAGLFMAPGPQHHFGEHRREVDALGRQGVNHLSAIGGISLRADDSVGIQPAKAIRQNIRGDFFVRVQKFVKRAVAAQHHVAKNQQRPAVSQHFHRSIQRTSRTAPGRRFLSLHAFRVAIFTCTLQVRWADCFSEEKWGLDTFRYGNVS